MIRENELSKIIISKAIEVHKALGPGLLESAYQACLLYELEEEGLYIEKEVSMPIFYKDIELDQGYRMDLLVEKKVVVELKAVESLTDVHKSQLLTYLKLGNYKLGLLINFNQLRLVDGLKRIINTY